jgi:hypothetical protein
METTRQARGKPQSFFETLYVSVVSCIVLLFPGFDLHSFFSGPLATEIRVSRKRPLSRGFDAPSPQGMHNLAVGNARGSEGPGKRPTLEGVAPRRRKACDPFSFRAEMPPNGDVDLL